MRERNDDSLVREQAYGPDAHGTVWTVKLYDSGTYDRRGQTGLRWEVYEGDVLVAWDDGDMVYGSPLYADDSDATMMSAVQLICHCARYNDNYERTECSWDAEGLEMLATLEYFHDAA